MKSDYETQATAMLDGLYDNIEMRAEAIQRIVGRIQQESGNHDLEAARRDVEQFFNEAFKATWTPEQPGLCLLTESSMRIGNPPMPVQGAMVIHVNDLSFSADPDVYAGQLQGATIREIAAELTDHEPTDYPTPTFIAACAELTLAVAERTGEYVPRSTVLNTEQFGLGPFSDYVEAAKPVYAQGLCFEADLHKFAGSPSADVVQMFAADGGFLQLIDTPELSAALDDSEFAALTEAQGNESATKQVLRAAASRVCQLRGII